MKIVAREVPPRSAWALEQAGVHPLLARLYAARGITQPQEIDAGLAHLLPPDALKGIAQAAALLADAIAAGESICIVADYDCDGATACAVAIRGLRMLGATRVSYVVPDRVLDGYGLTPAIAQRVHALGADVLVTVDNGIASVEGVAAAQAAGMRVVVTDHHLPGPELPRADALVNPNQGDCAFPSKCVAGVGVMFYVLLALRAEQRRRGRYEVATQPKLDALLPLVALGTVADVVKLDANNRRLVMQGLRRIRAGNAPVGLLTLFAAAGRDWRKASSFDFGFAIGPRVNAAGRMADMTLGIECLLTDNHDRATALAQQLDAVNRDRREVESGMRERALEAADGLTAGGHEPPAAVCLYDEGFHEGVVGIVASRIKDKLHRPTFVFAASKAPGREHELKGSGRSIPGFHLRDALDLVAKRHPGLLLRFGGHAMAAGCSLETARLAEFERALAQVAEEALDAAVLARRLESDGALPPEMLRPDLVDILQQEVWGQGFATPVFSEELEVVSQKLVGEKHLSLRLKHHGSVVDAIWFGRAEPLPARALLAYRLESDEWQGARRVRFVIEAVGQA